MKIGIGFQTHRTVDPGAVMVRYIFLIPRPTKPYYGPILAPTRAKIEPAIVEASERIRKL